MIAVRPRENKRLKALNFLNFDFDLCRHGYVSDMFHFQYKFGDLSLHV